MGTYFPVFRPFLTTSTCYFSCFFFHCFDPRRLLAFPPPFLAPKRLFWDPDDLVWGAVVPPQRSFDPTVPCLRGLRFGPMVWSVPEETCNGSSPRTPRILAPGSCGATPVFFFFSALFAQSPHFLVPPHFTNQHPPPWTAVFQVVVPPSLDSGCFFCSPPFIPLAIGCHSARCCAFLCRWGPGARSFFFTAA